MRVFLSVLRIKSIAMFGPASIDPFLKSMTHLPGSTAGLGTTRTRFGSRCRAAVCATRGLIRSWSFIFIRTMIWSVRGTCDRVRSIISDSVLLFM